MLFPLAADVRCSHVCSDDMKAFAALLGGAHATAPWWFRTTKKGSLVRGLRAFSSLAGRGGGVYDMFRTLLKIYCEYLVLVAQVTFSLGQYISKLIKCYEHHDYESRHKM